MTPEALRLAMAHEHHLFLEVQDHDRLAARWQRRADLASSRGDHGLAAEALRRHATEVRLASEYRALYATQAQAVREAKRLHVRPAALIPLPTVDDRLDALAREDRLNRDLAALKANFSGQR
jgi:hypothetical protein